MSVVMQSQRWIIGVLLLLGGVVTPGCSQSGLSQLGALQRQFLPPASPQQRPSATVPATARFSANEFSTGYYQGWMADHQVHITGLQASFVQHSLTKCVRSYLKLTGGLPPDAAALEAAGLWLLAPANSQGQPLTLHTASASVPPESPGVWLDFAPEQLRIEIHGSRQMPVDKHTVDVVNVGFYVRSYEQARQFLAGTRRPPDTPLRIRQKHLAETYSQLLFKFSTDRGRFPETIEELWTMVDCVPRGEGMPLPHQAWPGPGGVLLEANDSTQDIRWRVILADGRPRWIDGIGLNENFVPDPIGPQGPKIERLTDDYHYSTEGWRTLATFQF
ncbi:MAG: hypothetical protein GEEBNDBF_01880 [bacterium]|nr:hypothetical protein [bacterium]